MVSVFPLNGVDGYPLRIGLQTWRCRGCGRILAKAALMPGSLLEIKCKCHVTSTLDLRNGRAREAISSTTIAG